jgi:glycosyltransferase involved in cell wall biosynthesis
MRRGFPRVIACRMVIMPNPVRAGAAELHEERHETNRILSVGRLEQQKDHRTLIAAFARLAPRFPAWRLRIVGEGVLRPSLETQVAALGLDRRVELPGATSAVGAEYRGASIVAIPSLYESFGIATAEAMAYGVPVIGFADCPGTNELIVDGVNGLLVDSVDRVAGLAEGLSRLMSSSKERKRLGDAGPARAALFSPEQILDRWEELVTRICRNDRSPA